MFHKPNNLFSLHILKIEPYACSMETFILLATTSAPPTLGAEFFRKATSFAIEPLTLDPSKKFAATLVPSRLPTAFFTKDVF